MNVSNSDSFKKKARETGMHAFRALLDIVNTPLNKIVDFYLAASLFFCLDKRDATRCSKKIVARLEKPGKCVGDCGR